MLFSVVGQIDSSSSPDTRVDAIEPVSLCTELQSGLWSLRTRDSRLGSSSKNFELNSPCSQLEVPTCQIELGTDFFNKNDLSLLIKKFLLEERSKDSLAKSFL